MKVKNILNKLNYSIIEKIIKKELYHQINSSVLTKTKEIIIPTSDQKVSLLMETAPKTNKKNIQKIKISKTLSKQSKEINNLYSNKIIGSMELSFYKNNTFLHQNLIKNINKANAIWFIRIKNFAIEMPEENHLLWQYNIKNQKQILKKEVLIALYLIPFSQFFTYNVKKLN